MKYKGIKEVIFQTFLFNILFFIVLSGFGLYYVLPGFLEVEAKKEKLETLSFQHIEMKNKGLGFGDFKELHETLGKGKGLDKNVYLKNVLREFSKEDYEEYFTNTGSGNYDNFLAATLKRVQDENREMEDAGINETIKKILPEYAEDSSLSDKILTDFRFVNYVEGLLDIFDLRSTDSIGIGYLSLVDSFEGDGKDKESSAKQLEGKIYSFEQNLSLVGKKKDIINFIHYIENVGKVELTERGEVQAIEPVMTEVFTDIKNEEKINDFLDIERYFLKGINIYNNLVVDIKQIKFEEYPDSSELPSEDGTTFIGLIKNEQGSEKYNIDITLGFYVQGLPTYKIEEFIQKVHLQYLSLLKVSTEGIGYISKNKTKFKSSDSISAINNLKKFNRYLLGIEGEMGILRKSLLTKDDFGRSYKSALSYSSIFNLISSQILTDIKSVSEPMYAKYTNILKSK